MAEGEIPAASPSEGPEERRFDYNRTVAVSDGIFAIALTLLVLNLSAPLLAPGAQRGLGQKLLDADHINEYISYAISFAVIALLWVKHHSFYREIDHIDGQLTVLNLAYLGLVAFLPYPTKILGLYGGQPAAVVMYAVTVSSVSVLAGAARVHAGRARLLTQAGRQQLAQREHWAIVPTVFLLSIPIAFVSTTAALLSWLLVPALTRLQRQMLRP